MVFLFVYGNMLSKYTQSFDSDAKKRYLDKIAVIGGVDPYTLKNLNSDTLPAIEAADLTNYLVLGTSYYTVQQFKAYRSLEAYNQFVNGWVKDVGGCTLNGKFVVVGKVRIVLYLWFYRGCVQ